MNNSESSKSEIQRRKEQISAAKKAAEIVTLREWYDSTQHSYELEEYFKHYSNLGRLGKEANSNMRCDSFKSLMIINKLSKLL